MTDRDDEQTPREPEEGANAEQSGGPPPATWAGRQRDSSEDAGEHPQFGGDEEEPDEPVEDDADEEEVAPGDEDEQPGAESDDVEEDDSLEPSADATGDTEERLSQDTVEADTLELADREAAREAALAGLRARAAENKAKHGTGAITSPPPKKPPPGERDGHAEQPPAAAQPVPAVSADDGKPPSQRGIWARFAAASLLIIVAVATATSLSLFFFLNGVLHGFHGLPGVQNELAVANPGSPQTILILGSDKRPGEVGKEFGARSDTTILLRIASDQITLLSIPRDLRVNIPGHGIDKFNAAYSLGGAKLTVKVVKQLTGITDINHVVNVDFTGFADAVNSIGCVYVDVDQHYYHSNAGLPPEEQYAEIDIPAGYQRMCGLKALSYVRYRHDDNDLVRSARQQEFLREMRQELPAAQIASDYDKLKSILQKYVTLDIRNTGDLLSLAQLIVAANGAPVVQVHFPANLGGPTATYVTASKSAVKAAVARFEGQTPTPVPGTSSTTSGSNGGSGGGSGGGGGGSRSEGSSSTPAPAPPPLVDASSSGQQVAAQLANTKAKDGKPLVNFPIYYPTKLTPGSEILTDQSGIEESRAFPIDGPGSEVYHGYKFVAQVYTDGYAAYYGMSGTDWQDPPILDHPDETRTLNGTDYLLSWDGPQLRLLGWKTDHGSYWIENTLLNALTPGQMFGIAQSMQKYTG